MYRAIEKHRDDLTRLCGLHKVRRLALFGSACGDRFDPETSDLDFLVEFCSMSPKEHTEHFFGLLEDLQALFNMPVDLVERAPINNPYFLEAIEESRVDLYDAA